MRRKESKGRKKKEKMDRRMRKSESGSRSDVEGCTSPTLMWWCKIKLVLLKLADTALMPALSEFDDVECDARATQGFQNLNLVSPTFMKLGITNDAQQQERGKRRPPIKNDAIVQDCCYPRRRNREGSNCTGCIYTRRVCQEVQL